MCYETGSPIDIPALRSIFINLDMSILDDLVFRLMLLAGFRGLLRKGNLCEEGYAVCVKDVQFDFWGVQLSIRKSKTISFGERVFVVLFNIVPCSCFCFAHYLRIFLASVRPKSPDMHLFSRVVRVVLSPVTYSWFSACLRNVCTALRLPSYTSHSLRRGGAQALAHIGVPMHELKEIGD